VLLATSTYGPGLTPDSAYYLSAATSLRAGDGLVGADGRLFVRFPPLVPWSLALLSFLGLNFLTAARLLNAACLLIAVGVTARQLNRMTGPRVATLTGAALAISCAPFVEWFTKLLSEPLFIALISCFAAAFARALAVDERRSLVLASILAAALPMTRYVGFIVIPVGALLLLVLGAGSVSHRLRRVAVFVAIAAAPLAVYLARNVLLAGALTGYVGQATGPGNPLVAVVRMSLALAATWALSWEWIELLRPFSREPWAMLAFFGVFAITCAVIVQGLRSWWRAADNQARAYVAFSAAWVIAYTLFLWLAAWRISAVKLDGRFLAPIFLPCLVLLVVALGESARRLGLIGEPGERARAPVAARGVVAALVAVLLVTQSVRTGAMVGDKVRDGAGGYASRQWQESPFFRYVSSHPPHPGAISNGADAVFIASGVRLGSVPRVQQTDDISALQSRWDEGEEVEIVWFDLIDWRPYLVTPDRLRSLGGLRVIHTELDGTVYLSHR